MYSEKDYSQSESFQGCWQCSQQLIFHVIRSGVQKKKKKRNFINMCVLYIWTTKEEVKNTHGLQTYREVTRTLPKWISHAVLPILSCTFGDFQTTHFALSHITFNQKMFLIFQTEFLSSFWELMVCGFWKKNTEQVHEYKKREKDLQLLFRTRSRLSRHWAASSWVGLHKQNNHKKIFLKNVNIYICCSTKDKQVKW